MTPSAASHHFLFQATIRIIFQSIHFIIASLATHSIIKGDYKVISSSVNGSILVSYVIFSFNNIVEIIWVRPMPFQNGKIAFLDVLGIILYATVAANTQTNSDVYKPPIPIVILLLTGIVMFVIELLTICCILKLPQKYFAMKKKPKHGSTNERTSRHNQNPNVEIQDKLNDKVNVDKDNKKTKNVEETKDNVQNRDKKNSKKPNQTIKEEMKVMKLTDDKGVIVKHEATIENNETKPGAIETDLKETTGDGLSIFA